MTDTEIREAVAYLARDALYLARQARRTRASGRLAAGWSADRIRANAAHSLKLARQYKARLAG